MGVFATAFTSMDRVAIVPHVKGTCDVGPARVLWRSREVRAGRSVR